MTKCSLSALGQVRRRADRNIEVGLTTGLHSVKFHNREKIKLDKVSGCCATMFVILVNANIHDMKIRRNETE